MNLNPATMLNPVFNAPDALISDYGVYLYLMFVLSGIGAHRLDIERRPAETDEGKLFHGHSLHHHRDISHTPPQRFGCRSNRPRTPR